MDAKSPPPENPFSLWHGLAANWRSRVARHLCETADAAVKDGLTLRRDLAAARTFTDVTAAHSAATGRAMKSLADTASSFSEFGATARTELADTVLRTTGSVETPRD